MMAADVINSEGLSELVYSMIERHLAPCGLFVMVCPRPFHRHTVDVIRSLLLRSAVFETHVTDVPLWLSAGIEEAQDIAHELYIVQWRQGVDA